MKYSVDINYSGELPIPESYMRPALQVIKNVAEVHRWEVISTELTEIEDGYILRAIIE